MNFMTFLTSLVLLISTASATSKKKKCFVGDHMPSKAMTASDAFYIDSMSECSKEDLESLSQFMKDGAESTLAQIRDNWKTPKNEGYDEDFLNMMKNNVRDTKTAQALVLIEQLSRKVTQLEKKLAKSQTQNKPHIFGQQDSKSCNCYNFGELKLKTCPAN